MASLNQIPVDTSSATFEVTEDVTPALDFETRSQRTDAAGIPLWQVSLLIRMPGVVGIERVRFPSSTTPSLTAGQAAEVSGLTARTYVSGQRAAISLTAAAVRAMPITNKAA
jgi:hypothetical protein